jgi:hypothetical protein
LGSRIIFAAFDSSTSFFAADSFSSRSSRGSIPHSGNETFSHDQRCLSTRLSLESGVQFSRQLPSAKPHSGEPCEAEATIVPSWRCVKRYLRKRTSFCFGPVRRVDSSSSGTNRLLLTPDFGVSRIFPHVKEQAAGGRIIQVFRWLAHLKAWGESCSPQPFPTSGAARASMPNRSGLPHRITSGRGAEHSQRGLAVKTKK